MPLWAIAGTAMVMAAMLLAAVLLPLGLALLAPLLVEFQTVLADFVPPRSGVPPIKELQRVLGDEVEGRLKSNL
jgi:hypothetical protein